MTIIGDGPARGAVEAALQAVPATRLRWLGECDAATVHTELAKAHIYAWPGCGEAYGLAYLEAAAQGVAVVAMNTAGVAEVVRHRLTGLLTPDGDGAAFAGAVRHLIEHPSERRSLGLAGQSFVSEDRSCARAALILGQALRGLT